MPRCVGLFGRFVVLAAAGLIGLAFGAGSATARAAPPNVVVSIKPVHSLVAGVMAGIRDPKVLITGGASPHAYVMRPSAARLLERADVIFWIGGEIEKFLQKPLRSLGRKATLVQLSKAPGVIVLESREGGLWEVPAHTDERERPEGRDHDIHDQRDMHIWLGRNNAKAIVTAVAETLSRADPANAVRYRRNGRAVIGRIDSLHRTLERDLAPVRRVPYLVFHDAYQYFERDFGLNAVGSIATHEARKPGARRLSEIRRKVQSLKVRCIFAEPQFAPALVRTIVQGTTVRTGVLDPMGAALEPGPDAYFRLLQGLGKNLKDCLAN